MHCLWPGSELKPWGTEKSKTFKSSQACKRTVFTKCVQYNNKIILRELLELCAKAFNLLNRLPNDEPSNMGKSRQKFHTEGTTWEGHRGPVRIEAGENTSRLELPTNKI